MCGKIRKEIAIYRYIIFNVNLHFPSRFRNKVRCNKISIVSNRKKADINRRNTQG